MALSDEDKKLLAGMKAKRVKPPSINKQSTPGSRRNMGEGSSLIEKISNRKRAMEDFSCGGTVKKMASGGATRADGCVSKGKTRGKYV